MDEKSNALQKLKDYSEASLIAKTLRDLAERIEHISTPSESKDELFEALQLAQLSGERLKLEIAVEASPKARQAVESEVIRLANIVELNQRGHVG